MSLSQWYQDRTTNCTIGLTSSAIIGSNSLSMSSSVVGNFGGFCSPDDGSGLPKGLEQGRLRTLMRQDGSSAGMGCGLLAISNWALSATGTSSFYRYELFSTGQYALARANGNTCVVASPGTTLVSGSTPTTAGVVYGIQIDFIVDIVGLGGVYLSIYKGTATNFSDLVVLAQYLDNSISKLTTSTVEGVYYRGVTSVASLRAGIFDSTQLFSMVAE